MRELACWLLIAPLLALPAPANAAPAHVNTTSGYGINICKVVPMPWCD
ncbi:MAG TPA: hypothetical protein H9987_10555 [Candidatus Luteococcus avicola]|nr:hypothetical protein [Candidatus Luteococcus avicola]